MKATHALHLCDEIGKDASKGTRHGCRAKEQSVAQCLLSPCIKQCQGKDGTREEGRLEDAEKEAGGVKTGGRVASSQEHSETAPNKHAQRDPFAWADFFQLIGKKRDDAD